MSNPTSEPNPLAGLTPEQIAALTPEQIAALQPAQQPSQVPSAYQYVPQTQILSDRHGAGVRAGGGTLAWILAICTLGYLLPWAVAVTRGKSNSTAILLVNVLLGWTLIGWIVALVMASTSHQKFAVTR